jgi:hypothetical protein
MQLKGGPLDYEGGGIWCDQSIDAMHALGGSEACSPGKFFFKVQQLNLQICALVRTSY